MHNVDKLNRQADFDIAKGIGIILVVWAHANGPFSEYINQFHMPMFFFISGILYKNQNIPCKEYTKRKMKSLLFPFWTWNLIFYPIFFILYYWHQWDLKVLIVDVIEIIVTVDKVPFLGPTWFLSSLFWVSVVVNFIIQRLGGYKRFDVYLIICSIIMGIIGFNITFPYKISRTLICSMYYVGGYLYKKYFMHKLNNFLKNLAAIVSLLIYLKIVPINSVSMSENIYRYKLLFSIGAFLGTFFVLRLSYYLSKLVFFNEMVKIIRYLGINSIHILIWHCLSFRIAILIQVMMYGESIEALTYYPVYNTSGIWWIVYIAAGIGGSIMVKYLLEYIEYYGTLKLYNKAKS